MVVVLIVESSVKKASCESNRRTRTVFGCLKLVGVGKSRSLPTQLFREACFHPVVGAPEP